MWREQQKLLPQVRALRRQPHPHPLCIVDQPQLSRLPDRRFPRNTQRKSTQNTPQQEVVQCRRQRQMYPAQIPVYHHIHRPHVATKRFRIEVLSRLRRRHHLVDSQRNRLASHRPYTL